VDHLIDLAEGLEETALGFRWLAGLAAADAAAHGGTNLKSQDIENKADQLDHSAKLLREIAGEFEAAEHGGEVEDEEDDDEE